jgi:L-alanine-DL-glutamate epimerase-like enolase superfamily enzyme
VLSAEGVTGFGEAAPLTRYGQSYESVAAAFDRVRAAVAGRDPWAHREWLEAAERVAGTDLALVSALDMALWDWKGKRAGAPVHRLLGTPTDRMPVTSFSIGIDSADVMRRKTIEAADYPVLKVKVGLPADRENLAAVRSATARPIRVDANEGWTSPGQARQMIEWLSTLGVELIEQPLPARENEAMGELVGCASAPLVADESAERAADLPALVGRFHGINVKLAKCGGITRALEMIAVGRALGLKIMLGCMIESSLGIAAALALAPLVDWLDLDGNLLLAHDPFCGLSLSDGRWALPDRPGLGVERRS